MGWTRVRQRATIDILHYDIGFQRRCCLLDNFELVEVVSFDELSRFFRFIISNFLLSTEQIKSWIIHAHNWRVSKSRQLKFMIVCWSQPGFGFKFVQMEITQKLVAELPTIEKNVSSAEKGHQGFISFSGNAPLCFVLSCRERLKIDCPHLRLSIGVCEEAWPSENIHLAARSDSWVKANACKHLDEWSQIDLWDLMDSCFVGREIKLHNIFVEFVSVFGVELEDWFAGITSIDE